jgi:hypothetical protein
MGLLGIALSLPVLFAFRLFFDDIHKLNDGRARNLKLVSGARFLCGYFK